MKPLCIDLYCGLGGWAEGFLAEGYRVVGFDIERHRYPKVRRDSALKLEGNNGGAGRKIWTERPIARLKDALKFEEISDEWEQYPGWLVLQDVLTLHGSQFKEAACIVASPPCQAYSYRAMPWKRAKALPPPDNSLFDACFRIQREACEAAGRYIPLVVENVCGAQKWVGRATWHYGSYYLWGDVPALMPPARCFKTIGHANRHDGHSHTRHLTNQKESDAVKGMSGLRGMSHPSDKHPRDLGGPNDPRRFNSKSSARKAASALIAKIPFPLAQHIARVYKPEEQAA